MSTIYEVKRNIWKGKAEGLNWTKKDMNKLEFVQNRVGKIGLSTNRMMGTEEIRGDMGWSSFEGRIFKGTQVSNIK